VSVRWEYNELTAVYEHKKAPGSREKLWWWSGTVDGVEIFGTKQLLNAMGAYGWELVSSVPIEWQDPGGAVMYGPAHIGTVTYIFKRPVATS